MVIALLVCCPLEDSTAFVSECCKVKNMCSIFSEQQTGTFWVSWLNKKHLTLKLAEEEYIFDLKNLWAGLIF